MKLIDDKIDEFYGQQVPWAQELDINNRPYLPKNFVIKRNGAVIAGIGACVYGWRILYVCTLIVEAAYRHQGLGSLLLNKAESEAKASGAHLAHLDTFDFQAKDFYLEHGYEIFGVLDDCPPGHKRFYMKKKL